MCACLLIVVRIIQFLICCILCFEAVLMENWSKWVKNPTIHPSEVYIVHAGGYDSRVKENVEYFDELKKLLSDLKVCLS